MCLVCPELWLCLTPGPLHLLLPLHGLGFFWLDQMSPLRETSSDKTVTNIRPPVPCMPLAFTMICIHCDLQSLQQFGSQVLGLLLPKGWQQLEQGLGPHCIPSAKTELPIYRSLTMWSSL